ncbi:hypothetical protein CapIbe_003786 [Capra ibex]
MIELSDSNLKIWLSIHCDAEEMIRPMWISSGGEIWMCWRWDHIRMLSALWATESVHLLNWPPSLTSEESVCFLCVEPPKLMTQNPIRKAA